jgi:ABC-type oligopeptide transport system substrate-binding subunit
LNLTSIALAPLRDDYVSKTDDWAKKPGTMVTSGAFKLGKLYINKKEDTKVTYYDSTAKEYDKNLGEYIDKPGEYYEGKYLSFALERNACYYRNPDDPDIKVTKSVTPYRIIVDCSYSDEQLKAAYENGEIHFIGDIPVSLRSDSDFIDDATIKDALSTGSIFLNQDAMIKNKTTGEEVALFADANVRKALSAAIDRVAVAEALVFATPATGIVPTGIFNQGLKGSFRKTGGDLLSDIGDPAALLSAAGVNASDYAFDLIVNPNDDELMVLATKAVEAWNALGFEVTLVKRGTIVNNDYYAPTDSYPMDICDELYIENLTRRDYAAIAIDFCAYNQDAYSMLAPFATLFSGIVDQDMNLDNHYTGYCNESYNDLMEAIFYLPYFDRISSADYLSFANYASAEEFQAVLDACSAIYKQYGVSTSSVDAARSTLLHEAEKMLINDMAIIPVVFNQTATLEGKKVSKITSEWFTDYTDYFTAYNLEKTKFKNYEDHVKHLEQVYAAKTFYVCPSCGHQNEANALSSNHKEYLLTACSKCGAALSTDNIFGQYPFYLRKADAMKAENETK